MEVTNPLVPHFGHLLRIEADGKTETISVDGETTYTHQLRAFAQAWKGGTKVHTHPGDAIANMVVLDSVYQSAGLRRRGESPTNEL